MGITTTLEKLGDKFAEWHTDTRAGKLHTAIYTEIDLLKTNINNLNDNNNQLNQQLSNWIQQLINGSSANNYNKISNPNKYNLTALYNQINTIEAFLDRESFSTTKIKDYIDKTVTEHDTSSVFYNQILNNFLIQQDIKANDNLNNYQYGGVYRCLTADISNTVKNKPSTMTNFPFILIVLSPFETDDDTRESKNKIIRQILLDIEENGYGYDIYTRSGVSGRFPTTWEKMYGTHNTNKKTMQVEFEDGSPSQTWTILTV